MARAPAVSRLVGPLWGNRRESPRAAGTDPRRNTMNTLFNRRRAIVSTSEQRARGVLAWSQRRTRSAMNVCRASTVRSSSGSQEAAAA